MANVFGLLILCEWELSPQSLIMNLDIKFCELCFYLSLISWTNISDVKRTKVYVFEWS